MISIACKITNFSYTCLFYFLENIIILVGFWEYHFNRKNGWHASRINYWNTHKPVRFILSYVLSVTRQHKQRTAWKVPLQSVQATTENTENMLVKRAPQELIFGAPISQHAFYSAMFCPLHSNINKEQHEKHLCNPSSHHRKYREYTCETCAPYLDTWKP